MDQKELPSYPKRNNSFYTGKAKIHKGTMSLFTPTKCLCPEIEFDKNMVIFGQEDKWLGKLLYDDKTLVSPVSKHLKKKLQKWRKKFIKHAERRNERKRKQKIVQ